jgi:hypothetical protein
MTLSLPDFDVRFSNGIHVKLDPMPALVDAGVNLDSEKEGAAERLQQTAERFEKMKNDAMPKVTPTNIAMAKSLVEGWWRSTIKLCKDERVIR